MTENHRSLSECISLFRRKDGQFFPLRNEQLNFKTAKSPRYPSIEENAAHQLAVISIQLHAIGLLEPYQHAVNARIALLKILDDAASGREIK